MVWVPCYVYVNEDFLTFFFVCVWQILSLDGVLSYRDPHFWRHSSDAIVGSIHVQVAPSANEQRIIQMVGEI